MLVARTKVYNVVIQNIDSAKEMQEDHNIERVVQVVLAIILIFLSTLLSQESFMKEHNYIIPKE